MVQDSFAWKYGPLQTKSKYNNTFLIKNKLGSQVSLPVNWFQSVS